MRAHFLENIKIKVLFTMVLMLFLASCASPVLVNVADFNAQQSANSFDVPLGKARVYFVGGRTGNNISIKVAMVGGAQLAINGFSIGQIDRNDVLVADIEPGEYSFSWAYPSRDSATDFVQKRMNAGDIILLQAYWDTGFGVLSPARYEINEVYDRNLFVNKRMVLPMTCPSSICAD